MQIAFVGLGAMGLPMARNLIRAGFALRGYDMRAAALDELHAAGGAPCASTVEAAQGADALVLMVVNAAQAEAVLFPDGALDALAPGAMVLLMSTCPPVAVAAIGARVAERGYRFLDAPVSGGTAGAAAASLSIMVAAAPEDFDAAAPILRAVGAKIFHVGTRFGQGAAVKTVNQLLCGVHLAAAGEALSLARRIGIDPQVALEIVGGSAASSWMLCDRGPRMLEDEPDVTSAVDIFVKDLGIVLTAGGDAKVALPLAACAHQMFLAVSGQGLGAADDSQVIRAYDALSRAPAG
jgi:3-hydroxyisobutyrate dehydrogenase